MFFTIYTHVWNVKLQRHVQKVVNYRKETRYLPFFLLKNNGVYNSPTTIDIQNDDLSMVMIIIIELLMSMTTVLDIHGILNRYYFHIYLKSLLNLFCLSVFPDNFILIDISTNNTIILIWNVFYFPVRRCALNSLMW